MHLNVNSHKIFGPNQFIQTDKIKRLCAVLSCFLDTLSLSFMFLTCSLFLDYYFYVMTWLSEEIWLPPGIKWEELEGEEFAQFHHLLFPFIFSILFIG